MPAQPTLIVVMNDDPDACELLARVLELDGHRVERTADSLSVSGVVHDQRADLVVLDALIGGFGANLDALERLRNSPEKAVQRVRVVLVGASHTQALFSWQSGIDGFLVRPFHADDLRREVSSALVRRERDRSLHRKRAQQPLLD